MRSAPGASGNRTSPLTECGEIADIATAKQENLRGGRKNPKPHCGEPATLEETETEAESPQHITPTHREERERRHITAEAATYQKKEEQERNNHASAAIGRKDAGYGGEKKLIRGVVMAAVAAAFDLCCPSVGCCGNWVCLTEKRVCGIIGGINR